MKRLLAPIFLLLFASACGKMWSGPPEEEGTEEAAPEGQQAQAPAAESAVPTSRAKRAVLESGTSTVEVLWQVPSEAVEKYHLYYGLEADELSNHIEVPVAELQKVDDPKHGPVYRYELRDIPSQRAIYLSLRAENKYGMSEPSPATRVAPGQQTVTP